MMGRRLHGPSDEVYAWVFEYFHRFFIQGVGYFNFLAAFFEKYRAAFDPRSGVLTQKYTPSRVESIRLSRQIGH